jgi:hypothetical protein
MDSYSGELLSMKRSSSGVVIVEEEISDAQTSQGSNDGAAAH